MFSIENFLLVYEKKSEINEVELTLMNFKVLFILIKRINKLNSLFFFIFFSHLKKKKQYHHQQFKII